PSLLVVAIVVCCGKGGKIFDFSTLSTTLCSSVALNLAKLHLVCQVTNSLNPKLNSGFGAEFTLGNLVRK
ncbi:MAG: hypothetical protein IJK06_09295, partial [Clostridia bacterium]|nr:hypothetical protein [Clostridia bacterium]